jgi:hypothetical protein
MPQPTKCLPKTMGVIYHAASAQAPFAGNPEIKVAIAEIFMAWGGLEFSQLRLFIALMGNRQKLATDIFFRLNTRGTRADAVSAIAAYRFLPGEMGVFTALDRAIKAIAKERDKFAHWMYGVLVFMGEDPNAPERERFKHSFALVDPKLMTSAGNKARSGFVYAVKDLVEVRDTISRLAFQLGGMARAVQDNDLESRRRQFAALSLELGAEASKSHPNRGQSNKLG